MPELQWSCKHLLDGECWRHMISKKCEYSQLTAQEMEQNCREFKRGMVMV